MENLIKSDKEIEIMRKGGKVIAEILRELTSFTTKAKNTLEIEFEAQKLLLKFNVKSAFLGQYGYKFVTCLSNNDAIIHGIPNEVPLVYGDVLKLDIGIIFENMYLDHAVTVVYGEGQSDFDQAKYTKQLRIKNIAKNILQKVEGSIKANDSTLDISKIIDKEASNYGYSPNYDYIGHGVGKELHEKPDIFCFYDKSLPSSRLEAGMTIAIEPMISENFGETYVDDKDGFSVKIIGGGLSAFFEDTVLVTENGLEILTK